jgi:hypothetical protein
VDGVNIKSQEDVVVEARIEARLLILDVQTFFTPASGFDTSIVTFKQYFLYS